MPDADGLFEFVGGIVVLTATVAFAVGKLVFLITKGLVKCVAEEVEDRHRVSRAEVVMERVASAPYPLTTPWMGGNNAKFKLLGTIDVVGGLTSGYNTIILHSIPQPGAPPRTFHLEPVSMFNWTANLDSRMSMLERETCCFKLRVFTQDGRVASCFALGSVLLLDTDDTGTPFKLWCADTVHALIVDVLWPGATLEYHIGNDYRINIPKDCHLSSPPTPQEFDLHGLRVTRNGYPDFGASPISQSCWDCVYYYLTPRRGVHQGSGTRWCLHGGESDMLPDQLFDGWVGAITSPFLMRFATEKRSVDKENKTYRLYVQTSRAIELPPFTPAPENMSQFTTTFRTAPVPPGSVTFMSRGAHPKSPAGVRWEMIMRGEPCSHASGASSAPGATFVEEAAPDGAAFMVTLDDLPRIHAQGLVPIAGVGGMNDTQTAALSLSVADCGRWVYWKVRNQCLACATAVVRERFRSGAAVVFA
jgi:hypothetical protein